MNTVLLIIMVLLQLATLGAVLKKRTNNAAARRAHGMELARIALAHAGGDVPKACDAFAIIDLREDGKNDFSGREIRVLVTAAKAQA